MFHTEKFTSIIRSATCNRNSSINQFFLTNPVVKPYLGYEFVSLSSQGSLEREALQELSGTLGGL